MKQEAFELSESIEKFTEESKRASIRSVGLIVFLSFAILFSVAYFLGDEFFSDLIQVYRNNNEIAVIDGQIEAYNNEIEAAKKEMEKSHLSISESDEKKEIIDQRLLDIDKLNKNRDRLLEIHINRKKEQKNRKISYEDVAHQFAKRFPALILILFFVGTLASLYRYNIRMAAFYKSRAEILRTLQSGATIYGIKDITDALTPNHVDVKTGLVKDEYFIDLIRQYSASIGRQAK